MSQLRDPDPNFSIQQCWLTIYVDGFAKTLNQKYRLEVAEELFKQLAQHKYGDLLRECKSVSLNIESSSSTTTPVASNQDCDLKLNLPSILNSLDTSVSPYIQQVQIEEKVQEQIGLVPRCEVFTKYLCKLEKSTFSISLHAKNIKIIQATFRVGDKVHLSTYTSYEEDTQILHLWFQEQLQGGVENCELLIESQFDLDSYWSGCYCFSPENVPVKREDEESKNEYKTNYEYHMELLKKSSSRIVTTQFESIYARRVFPCLDLPGRKCSYTIRIISTPEIDLCVSNMPQRLYRVLSEGNGLQIWEFEPTPPLPTYLLTWTLATKGVYATLKRELKLIDFQLPKLETNNACLNHKSCYEKPLSSFSATVPVTVRLIVPKNRIPEGNFALNSASDILTFFWNYFRIPLPLRKIDFVSLPHLRPGAMENFGCMTYRESELLPFELHIPNDTSLISRLQKQGSAKIIAHELAHSWCGDLITAKDWSQLWVNESLATYYAHVAIDHLFPSWNVASRFVAMDLKMVQENDWNIWFPKCKQDIVMCIESKNRSIVTHPTFFQQVTNIEAVFDGITYTKGAAILRFMEGLIGQEQMKWIIHSFIHTYQYQHGSFELFKKVLSEACQSLHFNTLVQTNPSPLIEEISITKIIDHYFTQPGFPIVLVEASIEKKSINITILDYKGKQSSDSSNNWYLPIFQEPRLIFDPKVRQWSIQFETIDKLKSFLRLNKNGYGYYVTVYNAEGYTLLGEMMNELTRIDKVHLLSDCFFAFRRELIPFSQLTKFFQTYQNERDSIVLLYWFTTLRELSMYFRFIPKMRKYCQVFTTRFFEGIMTNVTDDKLWKLIQQEVKLFASKEIELDDELLNLPNDDNDDDAEEEEEKEVKISTQTIDEEESKKKKNNEMLKVSVDLLLNSLVQFLKTNPSFLPPTEVITTTTKKKLHTYNLSVENWENMLKEDDWNSRFPFHPRRVHHSLHCYESEKEESKPFKLRLVLNNKKITKCFSWKSLQSLLHQMFPLFHNKHQYQKWSYIMTRMNQEVPKFPHSNKKFFC